MIKIIMSTRQRIIILYQLISALFIILIQFLFEFQTQVWLAMEPGWRWKSTSPSSIRMVVPLKSTSRNPTTRFVMSRTIQLTIWSMINSSFTPTTTVVGSRFSNENLTSFIIRPSYWRTATTLNPTWCIVKKSFHSTWSAWNKTI